MKQLTLILLLAVSIISCKKDILTTDFSCSSSSIGETKEIADVLKKFKLEIPTTWKKQLYYDEYKSQIYAADTTKKLTKSYIFDASWHQGELNFDEEFEAKVKANLTATEGLKTIKSGYGQLKDKETYYNLAEGKFKEYPYNFLQVYVKYGVDEYFLFTTKVYGEENINKRICESVNIINNITFLK